MSEENNQPTAPSSPAGGDGGDATDPDAPQTHFESVLLSGQQDQSRAGEVIGAFLSAELFFLSREEVTPESGNVQPLVLQNKDGDPVVALFTHLSRIPESYVDEAPYAVRVAGAAVVEHLSGAGIVINPGHAIGFEIGSDGVEAIRRDFGPAGGADGGGDGTGPAS